MAPNAPQPVVTIRPPPGDATTLKRAGALGLKVASHPMFAIEPVDWSAPEPGTFDALLIGSANALRHAGPRLAALSELPALCVGDTTARAARAAGLTVAAVGTGGMQGLLPEAEARGWHRLLRLSGEAQVGLDVPEGAHVATRTVYRVIPLPMPRELARILQNRALVLLHSGEAAVHFSSEVVRLSIPREHILLACLAPRIAELAGAGWYLCEAAPVPSESALLAMARQMCQGA